MECGDIIIIFKVGGAYCCATFGQGYGSILMRNVGCSSSLNNNLFSCSYISDSVGCSHSEDAGARCYGTINKNSN